MSLHTPGPWEIEQDKTKIARFWLRGQTASFGEGRLTGTGYMFLGSIGNGGAGNDAIHRAQANARLIAAAPDLLDALMEAEKALRLGGFGVDCDAAAEKAMTAIYKATNGS